MSILQCLWISFFTMLIIIGIEFVKYGFKNDINFLAVLVVCFGVILNNCISLYFILKIIGV